MSKKTFLFFYQFLFLFSPPQLGGWHHSSSSCPGQKLSVSRIYLVLIPHIQFMSNLYGLYLQNIPQFKSFSQSPLLCSRLPSSVFYIMAKASLPPYNSTPTPSPFSTGCQMIFKKHKSGHLLSCSDLSIAFSTKSRVPTQVYLVRPGLALTSSLTTSPPLPTHSPLQPHPTPTASSKCQTHLYLCINFQL